MVCRNAVKKQSPSAGTGTWRSPYGASICKAVWSCPVPVPGCSSAPDSELDEGTGPAAIPSVPCSGLNPHKTGGGGGENTAPGPGGGENAVPGR